MIFEWDEDKNQINIAKLKISFETALHVFDDPDYIEMYDFDHSVDEDRLISARLATAKEKRLYYDQDIRE